MNGLPLFDWRRVSAGIFPFPPARQAKRVQDVAGRIASADLDGAAEIWAIEIRCLVSELTALGVDEDALSDHLSAFCRVVDLERHRLENWNSFRGQRR